MTFAGLLYLKTVVVALLANARPVCPPPHTASNNSPVYTSTRPIDSATNALILDGTASMHQ